MFRPRQLRIPQFHQPLHHFRLLWAGSSTIEFGRDCDWSLCLPLKERGHRLTSITKLVMNIFEVLLLKAHFLWRSWNGYKFSWEWKRLLYAQENYSFFDIVAHWRRKNRGFSDETASHRLEHLEEIRKSQGKEIARYVSFRFQLNLLWEFGNLITAFINSTWHKMAIF